MENSIKRKKTFFQKVAEIFFTVYLITLYLFVDRNETVIYSKIAFIIFAGLTVLVILQKQRIHLGKNVMIVYLAFTWMLATYFWAKNEYVAYLMMKTMWQLFILFFLTYNLFCEEENAHEYLLKSLYIAGIALLGYSIYTYGLGEVIEMMTTQLNVRLGKEINQENSFGMMNATTVMVAFYYLLYKKRYKLFHITIIAGAFLFAMSSGSRKALLMICIGVLYLIYKKYGVQQMYKVIAIVLAVFLLFIAVIQLPAFDHIRSRMEGLVHTLKGDGQGDGSSDMRYSMIKDGWNIYKDRIITGFGANNYAIVSRYRTYAHNNFIEILVDFGLVGFILYYSIYWSAIKNLWTTKHDAGKGLLCVFVVRTMMEMALVIYYSKLHWVLMAFFLITNSNIENKRKGEIENENIPEKIEESNI